MLGFVIQATMIGQSPNQVANPITEPFNASFWNAYADKLHLNPSDKNEFITAHKKSHQQISAPINPPAPQNQKPALPQNLQINAGPCINIDFENGSLVGWNASAGFHPIFNPLGCCPNAGGQQVIMSGPGLDPAGNFPVVSQGGNFSLKLGNNVNGGQADRIEQTFMVSPNNANFTYRYAVVFQDPGHIVAEQPSFQIVMLDSLGGNIPCTQYNVSAGQGIPGFMNSLSLPGVIYKPWTNVMVDLTSYIGQNVTIRFTTYDCALGGHYGYAYIDGSCQSFITGSSDSVCVGGVKNFCALNGLASYTWNGPGIVNQNGQCINASIPGIYTVQTTLFTGCTGPSFTYTLYNAPNPVVSFNTNSQNACAQQYTFTNTSSIPSGFISSYNWNFGGGNSSLLANPIFLFPTPGTYPVTLTAVSNKSCTASATQTIAIYPNPIAAFNAPATCQNAIVNFSNTSTIPTGTIVSHSWNFGNGNTSTLINPTQTYNGNGTYTVSLSVTSNQNCVSTITTNLTIYPQPQVAFTAANVCQGNNSNFVNTSSIVSGNINNYIWDLDNDGIPNTYAVNPSTIYPSAGNYTVTLNAISNNNCLGTASSVIYVFANPTASFSANSVCLGKPTNFTNYSSMQPGGQIISYAWSLGNGTYTNTTNPLYTYNTPGNYTVQLVVLANNGCSSICTKSIDVHHLPSVNFTSNNACKEQITQFNNNTILNVGTVTKWRWDFENDGIWDDTLNANPSLVYANSGNFNTKLEATSNFQCVSTKTNSVKVYTNPVADFINSPVCLGDVSSFTNTSYSTDGNISSNQWDFNGDNVIDNIAKNPTITYTSNGVYLLRLEVQSIYGCINVKSKSMYVNPKPQPLFETPNRAGCPSFCVTFTNNSTIATGKIVNAFWQFGDGSATEVNMKNPSHCYGTGNYDVSLTLVSDSGCRSTTNKPAYVTVYPEPVAGFRVEPEEVDENDPQIDVTSNSIGADATTYFINDKNATLYQENFHYTFKNVSCKKSIWMCRYCSKNVGCKTIVCSLYP